MTTLQPWSREKRDQVKRKIDKEAKRVAARLKASGVIIIAFYPDGEYLHTQDGGNSPMPMIDLYRMMATGPHHHAGKWWRRCRNQLIPPIRLYGN